MLEHSSNQYNPFLPNKSLFVMEFILHCYITIDFNKSLVKSNGDKPW